MTNELNVDIKQKEIEHFKNSFKSTFYQKRKSTCYS